MTRQMRGTLRGMSVALAALMAGVTAQSSWADDEDGEGTFDVADVLAELNDTDGDLGFHALIDGEAWALVEMEAPNGHKILQVRPRRNLAQQGLTELFFESAEPTFDELSPEGFFERFPEGEYTISGRTIEGDELESTAVFTHVMPAPPVISVNGDELPEDCDEGPVPEADDPNDITISWDAVELSHPEIGRTNEPIDVEKYQVVVEREEDPALKFTADLPPNVTTLKLPEDLANSGDEFKVEVLVREASGNQTATESCFEVGDEE